MGSRVSCEWHGSEEKGCCKPKGMGSTEYESIDAQHVTCIPPKGIVANCATLMALPHAVLALTGILTWSLLTWVCAYLFVIVRRWLNTGFKSFVSNFDGHLFVIVVVGEARKETLLGHCCAPTRPSGTEGDLSLSSFSLGTLHLGVLLSSTRSFKVPNHGINLWDYDEGIWYRIAHENSTTVGMGVTSSVPERSGDDCSSLSTSHGEHFCSESETLMYFEQKHRRIYGTANLTISEKNAETRRAPSAAISVDNHGRYGGKHPDAIHAATADVLCW